MAWRRPAGDWRVDVLRRCGTEEAPPPNPLSTAVERGSKLTVQGYEAGGVGVKGEVQAASARGGPDK